MNSEPRVGVSSPASAETSVVLLAQVVAAAPFAFAFAGAADAASNISSVLAGADCARDIQGAHAVKIASCSSGCGLRPDHVSRNLH